MAAKIVLVFGILFGAMVAIYWLSLKYALPYYHEWKQEEYKTERAELKATERLVEEAEREHRRRK